MGVSRRPSGKGSILRRGQSRFCRYRLAGRGANAGRVAVSALPKPPVPDSAMRSRKPPTARQHACDELVPSPRLLPQARRRRLAGCELPLLEVSKERQRGPAVSTLLQRYDRERTGWAGGKIGSAQGIGSLTSGSGGLYLHAERGLVDDGCQRRAEGDDEHQSGGAEATPPSRLTTQPIQDQLDWMLRGRGAWLGTPRHPGPARAAVEPANYRIRENLRDVRARGVSSRRDYP